MTDISLAGVAPARPTAIRLRPILTETGALIRLALPIMGIALVNMGMSITDTLTVSAGFGAGALAAVAIGSDFQSILFYLAAGIIGGLAPFYTAAVVASDRSACARLEGTGVVLVAGFALILVSAVWTAPDLLHHLGLDPALLAEGRGYTRAMALTLIPMLGVVLIRTILTAAERPGIFLKVTAAMLPLNALGNHVLMHGAGPIPAFGPTGAGLSSLLVAAASLGILVLVAWRTLAQHRMRTDARPVTLRDLGPVLRVGVPIGMAFLQNSPLMQGSPYPADLMPHVRSRRCRAR